MNHNTSAGKPGSDCTVGTDAGAAGNAEAGKGSAASGPASAAMTAGTDAGAAGNADAGKGSAASGPASAAASMGGMTDPANGGRVDSAARYVHKIVPFRFRGQDMTFELSHALFSSFDVDAGSRLLLKLVGKYVRPETVSSIVDIGSGVGVLGIACARGFPGATLSMRDRDALAVVFSARNAKRNRIVPVGNRVALFSEGLEGCRFDLVLCNVPAKAGTPVLDSFLRQLPSLVSSRGHGAIVVVEPIADATLASLAAGGAVVVEMERTHGHTAVLFRAPVDASATGATAVAAGSPAAATGTSAAGATGVCEPTGTSAAATGTSVADATGASGSTGGDIDYVRTETVVRGGRSGRSRYTIRGYWGLPEFDTPSFSSALAMEVSDRALAGALVRRIALINPGIGRVARHLKALVPDAVFDLCSRDVLSLRATMDNLGVSTHQVQTAATFTPAQAYTDAGTGAHPETLVHAGSTGTGDPDHASPGTATVASFPSELPGFSYDLLVEDVETTPRVDTSADVWEAACRLLKQGAVYMACAPSTTMERLERVRPSGWEKLGQVRRKGVVCAMWRKG